LNNNQPLLVIWWPKALDQARAEEEGQSSRVRYEVHAKNGSRLNSGEETLNKLPKDLPCLVLVNPSEVGLFAVVTPRLSGSKLKEALPFLVEPFLLNEPEENHVSLWPNLPAHASKAQLAAVLDRTRARAIVTACNRHGLKLAGLSCETLRAPTGSAGAAWVSGTDLILVDGLDTPLLTPVSQPAVLKVMLSRRLQFPETPTIELAQADHDWLTGLLGNEAVTSRLHGQARLPLEPLVSLLGKSLLNVDELRRMGMRPTGKQGGLRTLLAPALALCAVAVLGLNALAFKTERNQAAIEAEIAQSYAQALPDTPMVADPLLLIEREKRNLSTGIDKPGNLGASALLHEVGLAMEQAPFNSMVDFAWADNVLSVRFQANVTEDQQAAALQNLKARKLDAKWLVGAQSKLPVLQIKKSPA
jgi:type II secretion system protein L